MVRAIILNGPSGIGKSTVASLIAKRHNFKHCDVDELKWLFSHERSKERTEIGEYLGYVYARELIKRKHSLIIEALPSKYIKKLLPMLKQQGYKIARICLKAPLAQCIRNNATRKRKCYDSNVIREVYDTLSNSEGGVIDVTNKSARQIYTILKKKYLLK